MRVQAIADVQQYLATPRQCKVQKGTVKPNTHTGFAIGL